MGSSSPYKRMSIVSTFAQGPGTMPGPIYYNLFFELNFSGVPSLGTMDEYLIVRPSAAPTTACPASWVSPRLPILDLL
jgi:hypothetical protein